MPTRTRKRAAALKDRFAADPQKDALYEWEGKWRAWNVNSFTLAECRSAIRTACRKYGVAPPRVKQHREHSMSWCLVEHRLISLHGAKHRAPGGKNLATALHEAAHLIVYDKFGDQVQDHGPTFLGVFMWLLEATKSVPYSALHASARKQGLRWRQLGPERCRNRS